MSNIQYRFVSTFKRETHVNCSCSEYFEDINCMEPRCPYALCPCKHGGGFSRCFQTFRREVVEPLPIERGSRNPYMIPYTDEPFFLQRKRALDQEAFHLRRKNFLEEEQQRMEIFGINDLEEFASQAPTPAEREVAPDQDSDSDESEVFSEYTIGSGYEGSEFFDESSTELSLNNF